MQKKKKGGEGQRQGRKDNWTATRASESGRLRRSRRKNLWKRHAEEKAERFFTELGRKEKWE